MLMLLALGEGHAFHAVFGSGARGGEAVAFRGIFFLGYVFRFGQICSGFPISHVGVFNELQDDVDDCLRKMPHHRWKIHYQLRKGT